MSELRNYILSKASEALLEFDARAVMAKISKGVTGQGSAEGWDKPKPQAPVKPKKPKPVKPTPKVESTNLKDRIVDILMEAYRSGGNYRGGSRRRRESPRERQDRMDNDARDAYWSGQTDSQGNVNPDKVAPGGSDEGHKDSPQGHR